MLLHFLFIIMKNEYYLLLHLPHSDIVKGGHLDRLLGDYENEKSYLGLMIVYPEQLKGGLNAKISSFS